MISVAILSVAALVCVIFGAIFLRMLFKYHDEDWAIFLLAALMAFAGGACWCVSEAVKRADEYEHRRLNISVDAK